MRNALRPLTFPCWFEWQLFAEPYSVEADGDTIRMSKATRAVWDELGDSRGMAIVIEMLAESDNLAILRSIKILKKSLDIPGKV